MDTLPGGATDLGDYIQLRERQIREAREAVGHLQSCVARAKKEIATLHSRVKQADEVVRTTVDYLEGRVNRIVLEKDIADYHAKQEVE